MFSALNLNWIQSECDVAFTTFLGMSPISFLFDPLIFQSIINTSVVEYYVLDTLENGFANP